MTSRWLRKVVTLAALGLLVPGAAAADPAANARRKPAAEKAPADSVSGLEEEKDDGKVDAKALVQSGVKLLKQKDYLGALAVFRDAYQRFPSVKLLLNIGTTLKLLGRNAEAANAYQQYLDAPDADPARRAEVNDVLATLDRVLGRLELGVSAPKAGAGASTAAAPSLEVSVNGGEWLPLSRAKLWRVDPGPYKVAARQAGFVDAEASGQIGAGELTNVRLALVAVVEPTPDVESGSLMQPERGGEVSERVESRSRQATRSRLGLLLRGHFHVSPAGAAALVGPTFEVTRRFDVSAAVLIGRYRGGYLGGSFAILPGRLRPLVSAGVLVVSDDGARVAARGAVGVELRVHRQLALFMEAGAEHLFNPPMDVLENTFVPSAGVIGHL